MIAGRDEARDALVDALSTAGIEVIGPASAPIESEKSRSWLPWLRARRS
jgi:hypothetical protein